MPSPLFWRQIGYGTAFEVQEAVSIILPPHIPRT
jgi:hypothetical protein